MNRVILPDGRWFYEEEATRYEYEAPDGGSVRKEILWRTAGGTFVIEQWQIWTYSESRDLRRREIIDDTEAVAWMLIHGIDVPDDLANEVEHLKI